MNRPWKPAPPRPRKAWTVLKPVPGSVLSRRWLFSRGRAFLETRGPIGVKNSALVYTIQLPSLHPPPPPSTGVRSLQLQGSSMLENSLWRNERRFPQSCLPSLLSICMGASSSFLIHMPEACPPFPLQGPGLLRARCLRLPETVSGCWAGARPNVCSVGW